MFLPNRAFLFLVLLAAPLLVSAKSFTVTGGGSRPPALLRWVKREITVSISSSLYSENANIKYGSDVEGALERSFAAWSQATGVVFKLVRTENLRASPAGNAGDGINLITIAPLSENILLLGREADTVAGATQIFFNKNGVITEADVVLNPLQQFSTDGTFGTFDLESALMHEIGHLMGLDHSPIPAATMFANYWRNGILGLPRTTARSLSGDDLAAARALYGNGESLVCCGKFTGYAADENGEPISGILVWAEEAETGRLSASTATDSRGRFAIAGLPFGRVRVFAGLEGGFWWGKTGSLQTIFVGEYEVAKNAAKLSVIIPNLPGAPQHSIFAGLNGELATLPLPIAAGRTTTIYLGGGEIGGNGFRLGFDSPFIHTLPESAFDFRFENGMKGIGVLIAVDADIPEGDYSIFVELEGGLKAYLPGMLTVD